LASAKVTYLGFGAAFWYNTRDIAFQALGWRPILLLAFQAAYGFIISTYLLYIVAAEIPLVLPARAGNTKGSCKPCC
jgi:nitrate reductase NapE component